MPSEKISELVLATTNQGKLLELRRMLDGYEVKVESLDAFGPLAEPAEDGASFAENARQKACYYARLLNRYVLADDSGLEVDALNGAPGVRSARYAGPDASDEDRYRLLLRNLADVPDGKREAQFVCVVAFALPDGTLATAEGTVEGRVLHGPRGDGGFGYDPVFYVNEMGCTMAELATADKNRVSHRGRALVALRPEIVRLLGPG